LTNTPPSEGRRRLSAEQEARPACSCHVVGAAGDGEHNAGVFQAPGRCLRRLGQHVVLGDQDAGPRPPAEGGYRAAPANGFFRSDGRPHRPPTPPVFPSVRPAARSEPPLAVVTRRVVRKVRFLLQPRRRAPAGNDAPGLSTISADMNKVVVDDHHVMGLASRIPAFGSLGNQSS